MSKTTYAIYSKPEHYTSGQINKISDVTIHREGMNKIVISTINTLDDGQMSDIYWVDSIMQKKVKRLKDLIGEKK